jgi:hypothetical protein
LATLEHGCLATNRILRILKKEHFLHTTIFIFDTKSEAPLHTQTGNDAMLDCRRNGSRFNLEKRCVLHHNGIKYPCKTKNISISGVLVLAHDFPPANLNLGDTCSLSFSNDNISTIGEYESKVTRLGVSMVAMNFLSLTF